MKLKERYQLNKQSKVGETCICPSCGAFFNKTNYQQAFCKSKPGTICKDKYWNSVTPEKRNITTRISPASANFLANKYNHLKPNVVGGVKKFQGFTSEGYRIWDDVAYDEYDEPIYNIDPDDDTHPFSSDGLGQWL